MNRRYQPTSTKIFDSTAAVVAILDSHYKHLSFFKVEQRKIAKEALESCFDVIPLKWPSRIQSETVCAPSKRKKTENALDFLMCYSLEKVENDDELDCYLVSKCDSKPLEWWKENKKNFPRIAVISKQMLSCASYHRIVQGDFLQGYCNRL